MRNEYSLLLMSLELSLWFEAFNSVAKAFWALSLTASVSASANSPGWTGNVEGLKHIQKGCSHIHGLDRLAYGSSHLRRPEAVTWLIGIVEAKFDCYKMCHYYDSKCSVVMNYNGSHGFEHMGVGHRYWWWGLNIIVKMFVVRARHLE